MFTNKKILVTGGTGSFGNALIKRLLKENEFSKVIVFSRDEKKQHDMRIDYDDDRLHFIIGNIRDRDSVFQAMKGVDYVFHAAALKHVPVCEFHPYEAVKTNVIGSQNVLDAAEACGVKKVVVLSTDKAVYPINTMGITKSLMEKLMQAKAGETNNGTVFCGVRYGNVMYSRGSVIPLFVKQLKEGKELTITDPEMTRFLLPLPDCIDLVYFALKKGRNGDLFMKKAPAATVTDLALACMKIFSIDRKLRIIGTRAGEKKHETLVTREELFSAEEFDKYYRVNVQSIGNYGKFLTDGDPDTHIPLEGYTSENTHRMSISEIIELLLGLDEIKQELK